MERLDTVGFSWDKDGFERFDIWLTNSIDAVPSTSGVSVSAAARLLIFVSSVNGAIDEGEVSEWIPSPAELAEMERGDMWIRRIGLSTLHFFKLPVAGNYFLYLNK